jgi:hypothetical protein
MEGGIGPALLLATIATTLPAQGGAPPAPDIGSLRTSLRESLRDSQTLRATSQLVVAAEDYEVSGARYRFADEDVDLEVLSLPFSGTVETGGPAGLPDLYYEAVFGYANAHERADSSVLGVSVTGDTNSIGGLLGLGPRFTLTESLLVALVGNVGISRLENDTRYSGPNADVVRSLADGIAFNWEAWTLNYGAAARADWRENLDAEGRYVATAVARYDLRWTDTIEVDDPAQEFSAKVQLLTLQGEFTGPTGIAIRERDLTWRATAGYRNFLEGDLFGVTDFYVVGGALELDVSDQIGGNGKLSLGATGIFGEDLAGWTVGLGLRF